LRESLRSEFGRNERLKNKSQDDFGPGANEARARKIIRAQHLVSPRSGVEYGIVRREVDIYRAALRALRLVVRGV
jgi:hypothetical protein